MTPAEQAHLHGRIDNLEKEVVALRTAIKDLVDAWNTARGVTSFVKWVGSLAVGATILYNIIVHGSPK